MTDEKSTFKKIGSGRFQFFCYYAGDESKIEFKDISEIPEGREVFDGKGKTVVTGITDDSQLDRVTNLFGAFFSVNGSRLGVVCDSISKKIQAQRFVGLENFNNPINYSFFCAFTSISLGNEFDSTINNIDIRQHCLILNLGRKFSQPIKKDQLPEKLEYLILGAGYPYDISLDVLPPSMKAIIYVDKDGNTSEMDVSKKRKEELQKIESARLESELLCVII